MRVRWIYRPSSHLIMRPCLLACALLSPQAPYLAVPRASTRRGMPCLCDQQQQREPKPGTLADTTADGRADSILLDTTGDGVVDVAKPLSSLRPGDAIDTVGDGRNDTLLLDTRGTGRIDTALPQDQALPLQAEAQRLLNKPEFEWFSALSTVAVFLAFTLEQTPGVLPLDVLTTAELGISILFVAEFGLRWWSVGLVPRYLLNPSMLIDLLNILPVLVALTSASGFSMLALDTPLAPLRLLRALRILRLRRLLGRDEVERLARALTGDPAYSVPESQRVVARVAFSAISIVLVAAGIEWTVERAVNPSLQSYADALYFSVTTLTTVGFGDIVPATQEGRFVVALEMIAAVTGACRHSPPACHAACRLVCSHTLRSLPIVSVASHHRVCVAPVCVCACRVLHLFGASHTLRAHGALAHAGAGGARAVAGGDRLDRRRCCRRASAGYDRRPAR
jgi:voltage-gated potassium channel Kch